MSRAKHAFKRACDRKEESRINKKKRKYSRLKYVISFKDSAKTSGQSEVMV